MLYTCYDIYITHYIYIYIYVMLYIYMLYIFYIHIHILDIIKYQYRLSTKNY